MQFSFIRIFIGLLIIGSLIFALERCTNQFLKDKKPTDSNVFEFIEIKKAYEKGVKQNIDAVLEQIVGKKNFYTTVVAEINQEKKEELAVNRKPNKITNQYRENISDKLTTDDEDSYTSRPSIMELKGELLKNNPRLPGLVDRSEIDNKYPIDLPGFPKIESQQPKNLESAEEKEVTKKKNTQDKSFTKNVSNDHIYYDEQSSTTIYPTNEIKKMIVSVVLDKEQFDMINIESEDVEAIISKTAGLNDARGDELLIRIIPFASSTFGLKKILLQNKDQIDALKTSLFKFRWLIIGVSSFVVLGTIAGIIFLTIRSYIRKKNQIQLIQKKQEEEVEIKENQRKADEISEKKNSILGLAKNKPDDFSALIVNWIFSEEKEEELTNG